MAFYNAGKEPSIHYYPVQPTHTLSSASFKVLSYTLVLLFILKNKQNNLFTNPKAFLRFLYISANKKKHLAISGLKWSQEIPRVRQHFLPSLFKNGKLKAVYKIFSGAPNTAPCEPLFWQECFFLRQHRLGKKRIINASYF